jgi:predicted aldo/keto reductase-like oxidoreductase
MRYRKFGETDWEISALSIGLFRLPGIAARPEKDTDCDMRRILRCAIDRGVNFIDMGFAYLPELPESARGEIADALGNGYGDRVKIAVNLPSASARSPADLDRFLDEQTRRLALDRVDFCVLEGLNRNTWPKLREMGVIGWAERSLAKNRFGNIGFAFHDDAFYLREIAEACDLWSHCALQFSFMDISHHPGIGGMKFVSERRLPVIVTDPLKGRGLFQNLPDTVSALWAEAPQRRTPVEWGLRFVWDYPEAASVAEDIYSMAQLRESLALADGPAAAPGNLTVSEQLTASRVRDAYRERRPVFCTACRCCKPCPQGVDFVRVFEIYNDAVMYGDAETAKLLYRTEGHRAEACNACGLCLKTCPKGFKIPDILEGAKRLLCAARTQ